MLHKSPIGIGHFALGHARFGIKLDQIIHHVAFLPITEACGSPVLTGHAD
jgi:hypothetical protein